MELNAHIVVVDDDPDVRDIVERCLSGAGYAVTLCADGRSFTETLEKGGVDLVVVDLMLPDADGLMLTRGLKERSGIGVVILSGRGDTTERIIGLEIGADDYVAKPFEPRELLARVRSVLRRVNNNVAAKPEAAAPSPASDDVRIFAFDGWRLDTSGMTLTTPDGTAIPMSSGEFKLLRAFVEHPNRVLSRDQILDWTHDRDSPAFDRAVDIVVGRVRKKIESDPRQPRYIKTIRNAGYMFSAKVERR